jgi:hypothetical protein
MLSDTTSAAVPRRSFSKTHRCPGPEKANFSCACMLLASLRPNLSGYRRGRRHMADRVRFRSSLATSFPARFKLWTRCDPLSEGAAIFGMNDWFRDGAQAQFCVARASDVALNTRSIDHIAAAITPISPSRPGKGWSSAQVSRRANEY